MYQLVWMMAVVVSSFKLKSPPPTFTKGGHWVISHCRTSRPPCFLSAGLPHFSAPQWLRWNKKKKKGAASASLATPDASPELLTLPWCVRRYKYTPGEQRFKMDHEPHPGPRSTLGLPHNRSTDSACVWVRCASLSAALLTPLLPSRHNWTGLFLRQARLAFN